MVSPRLAYLGVCLCITFRASVVLYRISYLPLAVPCSHLPFLAHRNTLCNPPSSLLPHSSVYSSISHSGIFPSAPLAPCLLV
ncbi:hypothetical protein CALCODRAFT_300007 [Calocera cornea HHB12733]|uniref:Uncharacterized protein n=1 Tax=Calocera cornea HHB12733 TaxID=1353952 RepID=A0A165FK98_9BASI|nr:hypothetical protein CALCODRAFT_300007 [Calocera cornea HHB12733]